MSLSPTVNFVFAYTSAILTSPPPHPTKKTGQQTYTIDFPLHFLIAYDYGTPEHGIIDNKYHFMHRVMN
jgi:hypothetical protein